MKTILLTIVSVLSFTAFSQQKIVYLSTKDVKNIDNEIANSIFNLKSEFSVINMLKKELKRYELYAFENGEPTEFFCFENFDSANDFKISEGINKDIFGFVGVPSTLLPLIDTTENQINSSNCETEYIQLKNVEGEDSLIIDFNSGETLYQYAENRFCEFYFSLDDICGIVLMDGFNNENLEYLEEYGIQVGNFYTNARIGFVKTLNYIIDWPEQDFVSRKCITFSSTIGELEKITGVNLKKEYNKLSKKALKLNDKESKSKSAKSGISVFDISEVNELANFFCHETLFTVKDPHLGITLFNY
jgi:hypothetical protein